jgi:hypothetical protein
MSLEKLIKDRAYWVAEKKRLKEEGVIESTKCLKVTLVKRIGGSPLFSDDHEFVELKGKTCFQEASEIYKELNDEESAYYGIHIPFNDIWYRGEDHEVDFKPCAHCENVRQLKRKRAYAGRRIGAIHASLTRIGNRLNIEDNQQ